MPLSVVEKVDESQEQPGWVHYSYPECHTGYQARTKLSVSWSEPGGPDNPLFPGPLAAVSCNLLSNQEGKVGDMIKMIQITWIQGQQAFFSSACLHHPGRVESSLE